MRRSRTEWCWGRAVQCFECEETCYRNRPETDPRNPQDSGSRKREAKNDGVIATTSPQRDHHKKTTQKTGRKDDVFSTTDELAIDLGGAHLPSSPRMTKTAVLARRLFSGLILALWLSSRIGRVYA